VQRDRLVRIFQARRWEPLPEGAILLEEARFDQLEGMNHTSHTLVTAGGERRTIEYALRVYTPGEVAGLARQAGFERVAAYGGWSGEPLTTDSRLVLVARASD